MCLVAFPEKVLVDVVDFAVVAAAAAVAVELAAAAAAVVELVVDSFAACNAGPTQCSGWQHCLLLY